ncbi:hypothetical protein FRB94_002810 [Tulasnella sp. JGI-2019a]|nr:hypothetical protein FRB93_004982 [Tulasnella sp. JGI-2019a]KAG9003893.1 hypothetical protein FRB94_002810 [Tulasnella sp. JGI-2019a]KAG9031872.1 hypothetical protein FRB95_002145 [Tulasnella sp. JGI-2019a]
MMSIQQNDKEIHPTLLEGLDDLEIPLRPRQTNKWKWLRIATRISFVLGTLLQVLAVTGGALWWNGYISMIIRPDAAKNARLFEGHQSSRLHPAPVCHPPLPAAVTLPQPNQASHLFRVASNRLRIFLELTMLTADIDSLTVGVVTPDGLIFDESFGQLRANETHKGPKETPDTDSLYRIASISKMFCALELMVLKQRKILDWDDPVDLFLPKFKYNTDSWSQHLSDEGKASSSSREAPPITLRQLSSHMSGIGRDFPPVSIDSWPKIDMGNISVDIKSQNSTLKSIANIPLVVPQYSSPVYSNTGFSLLGWTLTAAANTTSTYAELIHRDVFQPLNISSSFNVTAENAHKVAVPSILSEFADLDLTDVANSAGGQYSSLRDLAKVMQTFLVPSRADSLLSSYTMREWLRPLHAFPDDTTEMGAPWEIRKIADMYGRPRRWYGKGGNLFVYHSKFNFNPDAGFGVVVLMTGRYPDAEGIALKAVQIYQAAFDWHVAQITDMLYGGRWISEDLKSEAITAVLDGSLWLIKMVLNGTDIFKSLEGPIPVSKSYGLWATGRKDEFRIAFGRASPDENCFPFVASFDPVYARKAPIDLILFGGTVPDRVMKVPSVGGILYKV